MLMLVLVSGSLSAAPHPDQIAAYRALVTQDLRLAIVSHRLASANAPFCARRERNPGWVLHDERQYPDRGIARAAFDFRQPIAVSAVVPGSAAESLGIKPGDGLIGVNSDIWVWNDGIQPKQTADRIEQVQKDLHALLATNEPVLLTLETTNGPKQYQIDAPFICASRFWVDARSNLDAGADGDGVRVTEGMMVFLGGDEEQLAALVAHELAHNLLNHRERLKSRKRRIKDVLATEIEADRLSVWLMANAGYDTAAALRFTERLGRRTGLGIFSEGTHLRWKNRMKVIQAEISLIALTEKQNGLLPPPLLTGG